MEEPDVIVAAALERAATSGRRDLSGRRVVVTAGGTREPLDPVRFLGNRSSGKQGVAIAEAARARGAQVTLIAANLEIGEPAGCDIRRVSTALELQQAVTDAARGADVVVMAAAVADYRPADISESKLKKDASDAGMTLELVRNPDILAGLGHAPHDGTLLVGFAAETEPDDDHLLELGRAKREAKGADLLVVNRVGWNEGFASDENAVVIIGRDGGVVTRAHGTKMSVADDILDVVVSETTTAAVAAETSKEHEPTT
jgi:phosphopantothenoylcysteine decarboxylase/phosphopantothenate--cysteine ligase